MSEFSSWDGGVEFSPLRAMFGQRIRVCIHCGGETKRRIIKYMKKKRVAETFRYCCLQCQKRVSPWTQFGFEDNKKRLKKVYDYLIKHVKPEKIKKAWIDLSGNILDYAPEIENLKEIVFFVILGETEIKIPCSYTEKLVRYYESPIFIKKNKGIKNALARLKRQVEHLGEQLN